MRELEQIDQRVSLTIATSSCDAMTGQDAVRSAKPSMMSWKLDGVIISKLDVTHVAVPPFRSRNHRRAD